MIGSIIPLKRAAIQYLPEQTIDVARRDSPASVPVVFTPWQEVGKLTHIKSDVLAKGNFMFDKGNEMYARAPTPGNSDAGGRRFGHSSFSQCRENLSIITRPARKRQEHWSRYSDNFKKSKDHQDAHLIWRVEPNSTIGPILSVRLFEFEFHYGLDSPVRSTKFSNKITWVTARFGSIQSCTDIIKYHIQRSQRF